MTTSALPTFLTAEQIANMLQVDERTVLCWADRCIDARDSARPRREVGRKAMLRWLGRKQPRSVRLFTQAANAESPGCR